MVKKANCLNRSKSKETPRLTVSFATTTTTTTKPHPTIPPELERT